LHCAYKPSTNASAGRSGVVNSLASMRHIILLTTRV
jgi:hypothetical protein